MLEKQFDTPNIGVLHLVWAPLGINTFENFLQSYITNRPNIEHDLIIIFNGFSSVEQTKEYKSLLENLKYHSFFIRDKCFDIAAYLIAANHFNYEYLCFLNSYCVILDKDWLTKMYRIASQDNVGLVGATGSYDSHYTSSKNAQRYDNTTILERFLKFKGSFFRRTTRAFRLGNFKTLYYFPPFPNYHIRTNSFMVRRKIFKSIKFKKILSKFDTHLFESGRNSLTNQILKMKLSVFVVGKDGIAYDKEEWQRSNTFRQHDQSNLIISDNRTDEYLNSELELRKRLSEDAWGYVVDIINPPDKHN
jgi:hypothetical protein